MSPNFTRTIGPHRRVRCRAAILAVLLVLAVLHAAAPHLTADRHCSTCQILQTSTLLSPGRSLPVPNPECSLPIADRSDHPFAAPARKLNHLRAPPIAV